MINYLMVGIADILLAVSFILQNKYQQKNGSGIGSGLLFSILTGGFSSVIFLALCGMKPEISAYSIIMAFSQTALATGYTLISFIILKKGSVALYTLFLMTGGMTVPYIWGVIFLNEPLTLMRSIGLVLIIIAVALSNTGIKKPTVSQLLLCIVIFILNGFVSVVSKLHQINTTYNPVGSTDFVFWTSLIKFIVCIPVFMIFTKKDTEYKYTNTEIKGILPIVLASSAISGVSYILQLNGASNLPATVIYPLITGGSIILSALAGFIILGEKPSIQQIAGIVICFAGTLMFL